MAKRMENEQLANISVDVQIRPDGKFDIYLADENSSGANYKGVTADEIGLHVAELVECFAEAFDQ